MVESRKNRSSAIVILFLTFVFFYFFHEEGERQITGNSTHSNVLTETNSSDLQAIIYPSISAPAIDFYRINTTTTEFAGLNSISTREFIFNNLVSNYFRSCIPNLNIPTIGIFFLQKVPEQGKEDGFPSNT